MEHGSSKAGTTEDRNDEQKIDDSGWTSEDPQIPKSRSLEVSRGGQRKENAEQVLILDSDLHRVPGLLRLHHQETLGHS